MKFCEKELESLLEAAWPMFPSPDTTRQSSQVGPEIKLSIYFHWTAHSASICPTSKTLISDISDDNLHLS